MDRYHRQSLLPFIGPEGQARLAAARVLLVGCGALGGVVADQLVRGGIGYLRIADRDIVELTNLQRQVLFDEADAQGGVPKAAAAARRLAAVNSAVAVEPAVVDVHAGNLPELMAGVDLIVDGTDNAETRYLINDAAVRAGVPWVYGGCVSADGRVMAVRPGVTACLRCVFPDPPAVGELPTCDTAGVLGPAAAVVASLQVIAAFKLILGVEADGLTVLDLWRNRFRMVETGGPRADCPCCGRREFPFLERSVEGGAAHLCGRDAVQVRPVTAGRTDLALLATKLAAAGAVERTPFLLRCRPEGEAGITLTVFGDGRTLVGGTVDVGRARSLVSRYLGG
jgi:molybdopterin/thiamine biosynthesis adenylyltransferase